MKIIGSAGEAKDSSQASGLDNDHHSPREVQREKQVRWRKENDKFSLNHLKFEMPN